MKRFAALRRVVLILFCAAICPGGVARGQSVPFRRGDSNADGTVDLSDAVHLLGHLFLGSPTTLLCDEAANSNGDDTLDLSDAVYVLGFLFLGSQPPPTPGPETCGLPPAPGLGCQSYSACGAPPVITSGPTASPSSAFPGDPVALSVAASDPDGDALSYSWSQTEPADIQGGFVSGQGAQDAVWRPPAVGSTTVFTLRVSISDGQAPAVASSAQVTVDPASLSAHVQPIFTNRCTSCHTGSFPSGGLNLTAGKSFSNLVNVPAVACSPLKRVLPDVPDDSVLYRKLAGTSCGSRMPLNDPTLTDREPGLLLKVRSWILAGAKDD